MTTINRFSSRRQRLDHAFLSAKLGGARSYRRIAGYFRSSIFELVGEEIAAIPRDRVFIHGKAGVIEAADGSKTSFLGSINETKSAFAENYEILWEDTSPEGVAWVEEEFEALWQNSYPLPDGIVEEIKRIADRNEIGFEETTPDEIHGAGVCES